MDWTIDVILLASLCVCQGIAGIETQELSVFTTWTDYVVATHILILRNCACLVVVIHKSCTQCHH